MIVLVNGAFGVATALRRLDGDLFCFRLTASEGVLRARILGRPSAAGPHEWCLRHLRPCLEAFRDPGFGTEIATDGKAPAEIAAEILHAVDHDGLR